MAGATVRWAFRDAKFIDKATRRKWSKMASVSVAISELERLSAQDAKRPIELKITEFEESLAGREALKSFSRVSEAIACLINLSPSNVQYPDQVIPDDEFLGETSIAFSQVYSEDQRFGATSSLGTSSCGPSDYYITGQSVGRVRSLPLGMDQSGDSQSMDQSVRSDKRLFGESPASGLDDSQAMDQSSVYSESQMFGGTASLGTSSCGPSEYQIAGQVPSDKRLLGESPARFATGSVDSLTMGQVYSENHLFGKSPSSPSARQPIDQVRHDSESLTYTENHMFGASPPSALASCAADEEDEDSPGRGKRLKSEQASEVGLEEAGQTKEEEVLDLSMYTCEAGRRTIPVAREPMCTIPIPRAADGALPNARARFHMSSDSREEVLSGGSSDGDDDGQGNNKHVLDADSGGISPDQTTDETRSGARLHKPSDATSGGGFSDTDSDDDDNQGNSEHLLDAAQLPSIKVTVTGEAPFRKAASARSVRFHKPSDASDSGDDNKGNSNLSRKDTRQKTMPEKIRLFSTASEESAFTKAPFSHHKIPFAERKALFEKKRRASLAANRPIFHPTMNLKASPHQVALASALPPPMSPRSPRSPRLGAAPESHQEGALLVQPPVAHEDSPPPLPRPQLSNAVVESQQVNIMVANEDECPKFVKNVFKKERCKNCGRPWYEHLGVIAQEDVDAYQNVKGKASVAKKVAQELLHMQQGTQMKAELSNRNEETIPREWLQTRSVFFNVSDLDEAKQKQVEEWYDRAWRKQYSEITQEWYESPSWDIGQSAFLCYQGREEVFEGKANLLKKEQFRSIDSAIDRLNTLEGHVACPEGFCVFLSQTMGKYFVLYRRDKKKEVFQRFGFAPRDPPYGWLTIRQSFFGDFELGDDQPLYEELYDDDWFKLELSEEPLWTIEQTSFLCVEGQEAMFDGKAALLRRDLFTSVRYALARLNSHQGHVACPEGFCIIFSQTRRQYIVIYRRDKQSTIFQGEGGSFSGQPLSNIIIEEDLIPYPSAKPSTADTVMLQLLADHPRRDMMLQEVARLQEERKTKNVRIEVRSRRRAT